MGSKYVPPHMRNKKVAPEPAPVQEESLPKKEEFPTLVENNQVRVFGSTNGKTFANLASTWAKEAEEQKNRETTNKQEIETLEMLRRRRITPLPQFHNVLRRYVEEEEEEEEEKPNVSVNPDEQGWTEVRSKKKYRRPKTFEERMARPPTPDESSKDETVWNTGDDETYWNH